MPFTPEIVAGTSSSVLRLAAFGFLRWIPSRNFPPAVLASLAVYLACVFGKSQAFGSTRPTLREAFPKLSSGETHDGPPKEQARVPLNDDEPVLYEDEKTLFKIFLFGIPNWREAAFSYLTIALNILLALCTLDLVFRAPLLHPATDLSFSRVGYVDSSSAKVLVREPDPAQLPIYVYLSPADKTSWTTTNVIYYLSPDTDYTHALTFDHLQPSKRYIYSLSNDKSGTFVTAPSPSSKAAASLTFLTSSCIKANFPYRPLAHSLSIHGLDYLSKVVRSLPSPASFMLFLGDFIYVDVPLRLSSSLQHYRAEYRRVYASPSWSLPGLDTLPWLHTLDDHEISNDWSSGNDTDPFPAASDPFIHYHVSVNPPVPPRSPTGPDTNITYFQFSNGPASFFMLDTRRYRSDPEPSSTSTSDASNHTMLGENQLSSLLRYLSSPEPPHVHWKIVASSVPFTKNWRYGTSDTWGGFLHERARILAAMHAAERDLGVRVIILSGDRHEFAAIRFPPPIVDFTPAPASTQKQPKSAPLSSTASKQNTANTVYDRTPHSGPHEFSVGPLSMFYLPIRTFKQTDEEDVAIKYLPDGNSKVGVVEIKNMAGHASTRQRSLLKYSLYIDGNCAWEYTLTSPPPSFLQRRDDAQGFSLGREARRWLWE